MRGTPLPGATSRQPVQRLQLVQPAPVQTNNRFGLLDSEPEETATDGTPPTAKFLPVCEPKDTQPTSDPPATQPLIVRERPATKMPSEQPATQPPVCEHAATMDYCEPIATENPTSHTRLMEFRGKLGRCDGIVMLDSGATANFASASFIKKYHLKTTPVNGPSVRVADGTVYHCQEAITTAALKIGPYQEKVRFYVLPLQGHDMILGRPWLQQHNPDIDWIQDTLTMNHMGHQIKLQANMDYTPRAHGILSAIQTIRAIEKGAECYLAVIRGIDAEANPDTIRNAYAGEVDRLLEEFKDVFPEDLPSKPPPHRDVDHKIELIPGSAPPSRPTYRMSYLELSELKKQLLDLLEKSYIQPSKSPYGASPFCEEEGRHLENVH